MHILLPRLKWNFMHRTERENGDAVSLFDIHSLLLIVFRSHHQRRQPPCKHTRRACLAEYPAIPTRLEGVSTVLVLRVMSQLAELTNSLLASAYGGSRCKRPHPPWLSDSGASPLTLDAIRKPAPGL